MIFQETFFRRYGARRVNHLLRPNVFTLDKFEFPKNSIWHYVQHDAVANGPDTNEYFFRTIVKKIFVDHQLELVDPIGTPRRLSVPMMPYVRQFHIQNKRFRLSTNIAENPQDENTLGLVNYNLLLKAYRYPRSLFSGYYKWKNVESTVWSKIREVAAVSSRNQYYFMHLPKTIPSLQRLDLACKIFNQNTLHLFNSNESLFLLEVWKWLSADFRKDSIIGEMEQTQLDKINLVIEDNGVWMMFNLGVLNKWRYVQGVSPVEQKEKVDVVQMQKRFLRAMMHLMSFRNTAEITSDVPQDKDDDESLSVASSSKVVEHSEINENEESVHTTIDEYNDMLSNLDKDLEQLDVMEKEAAELVKAVPSDPNSSPPITDGKETEEVVTQEIKREKKQTTKPERTSKLSTNAQPMPDSDVEVHKFETVVTTSNAVKNKINSLADDGLMDGAEYRRKMKLVERYESLDSPEPDVKLKDYVQVEPTSLVIDEDNHDSKIADIPAITDKSMLASSLLKFDSNYIEKVFDKDIVSMAVASQKAGFVVTDYEVEKFENAIGQYNVHTMRVTPIEGQPTTLRFRIPVVDKDGTYTISNSKYTMQKQRSDLPIRKINSTRVALSSYYGKTFVLRSEKKSNNYALWLHNQISLKSFEIDSGVTDLHPSDVFDSEFVAPKAYSSIAQYLKSFKYKGFDLTFDHSERVNMFSKEDLSRYEKNGSLLFGISTNDKLLVLDRNSIVYEIESGQMQPKGSIEDFLSINTLNAPIEYAEARIFSKNIPVGVVLGYKLGLSNLIEMLNPEMRRVPVGQRLNLQAHEYPIVFSDETLVLSKDDTVATMILAGFQVFEKTTKNYSVHTFDKTGVYLKLLEQVNLSVRYLKEIDLLDEMFVDPITEGILKEMGEPISYRGLLVRSCEMLMTDYHRNPLDMQEMRIKGYERMAGAVYTEIVVALREHRSKPNKKLATIDLNPYAVWKRITQDPSVLQVNDLNPIQNLKEIEAVTYGGTGGRSSRAMVKNTRAYHVNDVGIISEATRDSSDVAISTSLVADPKFTSLRGFTKQTKLQDIKPTSLVSTTALLSIAGDQDSAQRLNMASIQQSHSIACDGYQPSFLRTGYEHVVAHRATGSFSKVARTDGKVLWVTDAGMAVEYNDGSKESFELGRVFGKSGDLNIPHELASVYAAGDTFKQNDVLAYNISFFEKDRFNPKTVVWKNSLLARVALMESRQTHEDASSISRELAEKLTSRVTKIKNVVLTFDQHVRNMLQVGDTVDNDTILCYIEDELTAGSKLFDDDSLNTLKNLSRQAPSAKMQGVIEKIEIFYYGDIEDMTDSLRDAVMKSDQALRKSFKMQGKKVTSGQVDESFRIDGESLQLDSLAIRFYITGVNTAGIGDKGVFSNQLKTIFSEVMDYDVRTESGLKVDAIFGAQSIFNRIVNSAFAMGTTNTLLGVIGKKAAKIYKS